MDRRPISEGPLPTPEKKLQKVRAQAEKDAETLLKSTMVDSWAGRVKGFVPTPDQIKEFYESAEAGLGIIGDQQASEVYIKEFIRICEKGWPAVEA